MKRRDFLKKGTMAAGLASAPGLLALEGKETDRSPATTLIEELLHSPEEISSTGRQEDARGRRHLPKEPVFARSAVSGVKIEPMPLSERLRRDIVPRRGFCSIGPGNDALLSGNGPMSIEMTGNPYSEQVIFRHESVFVPHKHFEAPNIAAIFPGVRQMLLDGKYHEAAKFAYEEWHKTPMPRGAGFGGGPAFAMRFDFPPTSSVKNYLRTVDFESTELAVHYSDERGDWVRRMFASRPDNVVVQWLTAPKGQTVNVRIVLERSPSGFFGEFGAFGGGGLEAPLTNMPPGPAGFSPERGGGAQGEFRRDFNEQRLIFKGILNPEVNNSGYAGVTRAVREGGSATMDGETLVVENTSSLMLLTRIEAFSDYSEDQVEALRKDVDSIAPDYEALIERARKVQSEMLNRVTVDFGGASKHALSSEELLSDQRSSSGYSGAYLETLFEMCRYWFILTSGKYCSMQAETNANINLQIAPGVLGDHREGIEAYFNWMESLVPDYRTNARNIFGMRGAHYALTPTKESGVDTHFDYAASTGEIWPHPYWLSAGGWCVRPFWDHYLVNGDQEFLRKRVVPAYKDLALFYEDFLTVTDKEGNYVFVPSFSPENNPLNLNPGCMAVINASMDISVCREVLGNLVEACELLGIEADGVPKWKAMIAKLPPYLLEPDGAMKEWAWPSLMERYDHRHISHLYGVWPGDEIDPDRTPKLAKAALIADRHRVPERLAAHGRCHRALVGARLKDKYLVDTELRQLIEEGNVGETLRCSHDPYSYIMPDAQGGIPTILMEMLAYSRPGVIEVLPALPPSLRKGSIHGMLLRTFARLNKLVWDLDARTVDLTITSVKKQDVSLIARQGIEDILASPGALAPRPDRGAGVCDLHLLERKPVEIHLKLGRRNPLDWVHWVD
jgi:alpha-L-fucosidase 2